MTQAGWRCSCMFSLGNSCENACRNHCGDSARAARGSKPQNCRHGSFERELPRQHDARKCGCSDVRKVSLRWQGATVLHWWLPQRAICGSVFSVSPSGTRLNSRAVTVAVPGAAACAIQDLVELAIDHRISRQLLFTRKRSRIYVPTLDLLQLFFQCRKRMDHVVLVPCPRWCCVDNRTSSHKL